ncbi:hypothetical protein WR25_12891 [Diploscapter pachys]|uniref:G-protein coupled receptors family 1 profile domain-containing protein n=1 Tax=Diploscapter pachys TaxID=2018661 RepID=A0A2A2LFL6_9BILA|nr:hypothetical protein WR25_12891 [Diploscapter pachys]
MTLGSEMAIASIALRNNSYAVARDRNTDNERSMDSVSGLPLAMLFSLLTLIGVLGNLIVIYAIAGDKKMRSSVMNILLLNLAVADLLNLVFTSSEWLSPVTLGTTQWLWPAFLCSVCRYLECVFLFTSISTQLIVCVERYLAIIYPLRARLYCSRPNAFIAVLVAWAFSALFAAPYAYLNFYKSSSEQCVNRASRSQWWMRYKMAEFVTFYLVPIVLIVCVYLRICTVLWAKDPTLAVETQHLETQKKASESLKTRRNVVKMLIACVFVYFICYSPIQVIFLSKALLNVTIHPPYEFILIFNALAMTCSASNPLLYTLFSTKFRRRLRHLLFCSRDSGFFSKDFSQASPRPTQITNYYALNQGTTTYYTNNNNSPTKCNGYEMQ